MRVLAPAVRTVGAGFLLAAALMMPGSFSRAGANESTAKTEAAVEGIALDIPGPWADREAFLSTFAKANGSGVKANSDDIRDADGRILAMFKLLPHDPKLANAIWIGTGRSLDTKTMEKITAHTSVAVVLVPETGPGVEGRLKAVTEAMKKAGGQALRVHYSGLSHGWERWEKMLGGAMPAALFQTLVVQVPFRETGRLCSFGMVQFGLADGCIEDPGIDSDAAWVLFDFNIYLWKEKPRLETGHTFSRNMAGAQTYVLKHGPDRRYPEGHDYLNPFGVWELDPKR